MPRQSVFAAGGVMILAAVLGIYMGVSHSLNTPGGGADDASTIVPAVTPVASAKPILTPTVTMDETEVRRLAREEAQALMTKSSAKKAAASDDEDDTAPAEDLTPVTPSVPLTLAKPAVSVPQP